MGEKWKGSLRNMLKVGTPECAVFCAAAAMVLALLLLLIGFWKTLLVVLIVCVGAFIGGVKDKKQFISRLVNRLFPPRATVPYQSSKEDTERVEEMRRAAWARAEEPAAAPETDSQGAAELHSEDEQ